MPILQLVPPPPAAPVHEPRVMTPSFQERLCVLNHATRELRQLGLQVVWSKLAGPIPQAHIRRDAAVSIGPLLDRMGPRSFQPSQGCTVVSGAFEGITVSWIEPSHQ